MAAGATSDVRDEIIRYLLNNRDQNLSNSATPNRHRFTQPIHKWPFSYAGSSNILELATFLNRVKTYADTEDVEEYALIRGIKHLLRGRALEWYARNYTLFNTWDDFKWRIKSEFLPPNFSQSIKRDLYWRFQAVEEPFSKYYQDMFAFLEVVEPPMTMQDQFFILKSNLNPEFAVVASASRASTVQDLVAVCKDYDNVRSFTNKGKSTQFQRGLPIQSNTSNPAANRFLRPNVPSMTNSWNRQLPIRAQVNVIDEASLDIPAQYSEIQEQHQYPALPDIEEGTPVGNQFGNDQELEEGVNAVRGPVQWPVKTNTPNNQFSQEQKIAIVCWQCEQPGHLFTACPSPKTFLFCYRCGKKGFTSRDCTDCLARMTQAVPDQQYRPQQGNGVAGFRNRRD